MITSVSAAGREAMPERASITLALTVSQEQIHFPNVLLNYN